MRRIVALLLIPLIAAVTLAPSAHAQTAVKSITLSPSSTAVTVMPGVKSNRAITLINDGDTPYTASLSVAPYRVENDTYDPLFTRLPGTTDASEWVTLSQTSVTLAARETAVVNYTVNAPAATAPGGYYAVVFAEASGSSDSGVSARNRVGNVLYITVDGDVKQSGTVVASDTPGFTFGTNATLGMRVTNSGGVHFQTNAHFTVKSLTGKTLLNQTTNPYVLPQTTRHIIQDFGPGGIGGIYKVSRSATVAGKVVNLPDSWIIIAKPQIVPLVLFVLLTIAGFIILLSRTKKSHRKS